MKLIDSVRVLTLFAAAISFVPRSVSQNAPPAQYPAYPSETPSKVEQQAEGFDFGRRNVMIPMRDGVKLHTIILVPKGAKNAPILLTRTPYDADRLTSHTRSSHLGPILDGYDNATDVIVEAATSA